jgi:alkylation response protein AidB-like acyl-CoA dehydrogenase
MELAFSEQQIEFGAQLRRFLGSHAHSGSVRRAIDRGVYDESLWVGLSELGATAIAIPEAYGGLGQSALDLCVVAEELGRSLAPVPFLSTIYLFAGLLTEAGSEEQKQRLLPEVAAGTIVGTYAVADASDSPAARVRGGWLTGEKVAVLDGNTARWAIVRAVDGNTERDGVFLVDLDTRGVSITPQATLDPTRAYAALRFEAVSVEPLASAETAEMIEWRVFERAAVYLAFEQVGGADRCLEMARDYSLQRAAFGRRIASFQAVKHLQSDILVANTMARSNACYAGWALAVGHEDLAVAAGCARLTATQAFLQASATAIQMHGGIGFTWDLDCHLFYRRAHALAVALGGVEAWERRVADALLAVAGAQSEVGQ